MDSPKSNEVEQIDIEKGATSSIPNQKAKFYESNAGDGTTVHDQYLHGTPLVLCVVSCFSCFFLIGLDQTIIITLLEAVGNDFNGYQQIGWVTSGFMLTMAAFSATWGKMSIIFGRKWSLLLAILIFEAGSLMCALASSINILIGGRVLAGIGGGGIQTLVFIVATEVVSIDKRVLVFMSLSIAFAISAVSGPLVGGAFTLHTTWRWCFYINLPIGGLAAAILFFCFHPPKPKGTLKEKLSLVDYVGLFLLTSGIVIFLLSFTFGGVEFSWRSGAVISMFIIGGILLILFCVWNFKYSKNPIIPPALVKVPQIVVAFFSLFTAFFCFMGSVVYLTTYFQIVQGTSPWQTGVRSIPMIIPMVIGAVSSGIAMRLTGFIKPYAVLGGICGPVGYGCLTLLDVDSSNSEKIGLLILPGFFIGLCIQTCLMSGQINAPKENGSTLLTTALFNFGRSLGGAVGADLSQVIFNASFNNKIREIVRTLPGETLDGLTADQASKLISQPDLIRGLAYESQAIVVNVVVKSIRNVFYTMLAVSCVTFLTTCFLSNKRLPKSDEIEQLSDQSEVENDQDEKLSQVKN